MAQSQRTLTAKPERRAESSEYGLGVRLMMVANVVLAGTDAILNGSRSRSKKPELRSNGEIKVQGISIRSEPVEAASAMSIPIINQVNNSIIQQSASNSHHLGWTILAGATVFLGYKVVKEVVREFKDMSGLVRNLKENGELEDL